MTADRTGNSTKNRTGVRAVGWTRARKEDRMRRLDGGQNGEQRISDEVNGANAHNERKEANEVNEANELKNSTELANLTTLPN